MISRTERHKKAAARRKRKLRRLAMHLAAIGFSVFLLGAGLYFIWNYGPERHLAVDHGGANAAEGGLPAVPGGQESGAGTAAGGTAGSPEGGQGSGSLAGREGAGSDDEPSVRLLFVGDIMMGGRVADLLEREGYDYPYRHVGDALRAADLAIGNLENPITDRGEPADKTWTFRTSPLAVPALKESGFDVLSLANNHVLDYGTVGFLDTLRYLDEEGIGRVGAGKDADEAYQPFFAEVKGIRIACLGFSHVVPEVSWKAGKNHPGVADMYDTRRAVETIREAREKADLVVVMVHWGIERAEEPEPYQVKKGREFIDAGADLVIGSHPHVLQGVESYNGKWIAYSLGNFIFTVSGNTETRRSAMLQADCRAAGGCKLTFVPVETGPGQPFYPDEEGSRAILDKLNMLSYQARVNGDGSVVSDPAGRVYDPEKAARKKAEKAKPPAGGSGGQPSVSGGSGGSPSGTDGSGNPKPGDGGADGTNSGAGGANGAKPAANGEGGQLPQPGEAAGGPDNRGPSEGLADNTVSGPDDSALPGPPVDGTFSDGAADWPYGQTRAAEERNDFSGVSGGS